eukprot:6842280-Prymnesium_polylepis.2
MCRRRRSLAALPLEPPLPSPNPNLLVCVRGPQAVPLSGTTPPFAEPERTRVCAWPTGGASLWHGAVRRYLHVVHGRLVPRRPRQQLLERHLPQGPAARGDTHRQRGQHQPVGPVHGLPGCDAGDSLRPDLPAAERQGGRHVELALVPRVVWQGHGASSLLDSTR